MKLCCLICVISLAAIAVGEKSQHLNINQRTAEVLINKLEDHHHDDHDHHNHHIHHGDHDHFPEKIASSEVDNPARDYTTWLAAGGKKYIF